MLIPDIRMKSRGASMPNIQASISQSGQRRDRDPGIAIPISVFTTSSLVAITQDISVQHIVECELSRPNVVLFFLFL